MARKEDMTNSNASAGFGVFTINQTTVGRDGNNTRRSDVQLVQFFLMQFYFFFPELFNGFVPKTKSGAAIIKIDGICGRQTELGIFHFQRLTNQVDSLVRVDGLVSVAYSFESIFGGVYTILHLNEFFRVNGNGKEFHGNLQSHPVIIQFAPELRTELALARVGDEF